MWFGYKRTQRFFVFVSFQIATTNWWVFANHILTIRKTLFMELDWLYKTHSTLFFLYWSLPTKKMLSVHSLGLLRIPQNPNLWNMSWYSHLNCENNRKISNAEEHEKSQHQQCEQWMLLHDRNYQDVQSKKRRQLSEHMWPQNWNCVQFVWEKMRQKRTNEKKKTTECGSKGRVQINRTAASTADATELREEEEHIKLKSVWGQGAGGCWEHKCYLQGACFLSLTALLCLLTVFPQTIQTHILSSGGACSRGKIVCMCVCDFVYFCANGTFETGEIAAEEKILQYLCCNLMSNGHNLIFMAM